MRTVVLLALISAGVLCGQSTEYLYALHSGGVGGFSINPKNGHLKKLPGSPYKLTGTPDSATVAPGGTFLYVAANDRQQYLINVFAISATTGVLTEVAGSPFAVTQGGSPVVDASGRFFYTSGPQGINIYTIDALIGALTPAGQQTTSADSEILADPQAPYLFTDGGSAYLIDPGTGSLTEASTDGVPIGIENTQGTDLYSAQGVQMFVSSFDASTGILSPVAGSPFTLIPQAEGGYAVVDPSDRFLYIPASPAGGHIVLSGYLLDAASGGLLTHLGDWKIAENGPYPLAVEPSGRFLYLGQRTKTISTFKINQKSGQLTTSSAPPLRLGSDPGQLLVLVPTTPVLPQLSAIQITPPSVSIVSSTSAQTAQFTAVGQYVDGSTRFLTATAAWSSSNTSFANIANSPGNAGLASTTGAGTATITAQVDGLTATASLTVSEPSLASIAVTPADPTLTAGTAIHFTATGTYTDGSTQNLTKACAWSSSDTSVATVGGPGHVFTLAPGSTTITAADGSVTATATLTVQ